MGRFAVTAFLVASLALSFSSRAEAQVFVDFDDWSIVCPAPGVGTCDAGVNAMAGTMSTLQTDAAECFYGNCLHTLWTMEARRAIINFPLPVSRPEAYVEAYVRIDPVGGGGLNPGDFLPVAEFQDEAAGISLRLGVGASELIVVSYDTALGGRADRRSVPLSGVTSGFVRVAMHAIQTDGRNAEVALWAGEGDAFSGRWGVVSLTSDGSERAVSGWTDVIGLGTAFFETAGTRAITIDDICISDDVNDRGVFCHDARAEGRGAVMPDAGPADVGPMPDTGAPADTGPVPDSSLTDTGARPDSARSDAWDEPDYYTDFRGEGGCSCDATTTPELGGSAALAVLSLMLLRRRRQR